MKLKMLKSKIRMLFSDRGKAAVITGCATAILAVALCFALSDTNQPSSALAGNANGAPSIADSRSSVFEANSKEANPAAAPIVPRRQAWAIRRLRLKTTQPIPMQLPLRTTERAFRATRKQAIGNQAPRRSPPLPRSQATLKKLRSRILKRFGSLTKPHGPKRFPFTRTSKDRSATSAEPTSQETRRHITSSTCSPERNQAITAKSGR